MSADRPHRMERAVHRGLMPRLREFGILLTAVADCRLTAGSAHSAGRDEHSMSVRFHKAFRQVVQGGQPLEMFADAHSSHGGDAGSRPASVRRLAGLLRRR